MSDKIQVNGGGVSFCGLLAIVFIVLKLTGTTIVAGWSWWWVLSPLWLPIVLVLTLTVVFLIVAAIIAWVSKLLT